MKRIKIISLFFCGLALLGAPPTQGANHPTGKVDLSPLPPEKGQGDLLNLDLRVYVAAKPIYCILVEKDRQRLRVLRHDGRLQVLAEYVAATGENFGPKEKEGDAKTPEGVYFISKFYQDRKVSVFGTRAFQLNYPNYFDLRAGRDGYGIFIHGTNKDLRFNSSNGCVTLNNGDLDRLADFLSVGTPVFIVPSLSGLQDNKGEYPNLAEHNFAGAKALLIPEASANADFASLYLIRINGQTVVIGEYWDDQGSGAGASSLAGGAAQSLLPVAGGSAAPQLALAVAYLQEEAGNRWSVVDRGPIASGRRESDAATIAGLPLRLGGQRTEQSDGSGFEENEEALPWQMTEADLYLTWYREARQVAVGGGVADEPVVAVASISKQSSGLDAGKVYGGFIFATCISIGLAWVFLRRQEAERWRQAGLAEGDAVAKGVCGAGELDLLQDEVKQAMGVLHTVQRRIDEEAINVESLEGVQARMSALEGTILTKQADIDQLAAEQAVLRGQGLVDRSGQVEALSLLQREMAEVKERLVEARQVMDSVVSREGEVYGQLAELRRLAENEVASKNGAEIQGIVDAFDGLRGQVQAMAEALQSGELSCRQTGVELNCGPEGAAQASAEVLEVLQAYATELKGLHAEMAELKGATETSGLEAVVQGLRSELRQEQEVKLEMMSQLGRLSLLEEELLSRNREHEVLRQESEANRVQAMTQKMALEATLESLRHELAEAEGAKSDLAKRLGRLAELETELAGKDQELDCLRQESETHRARTGEEKIALEETLESLRHELAEAEGVKSELAKRSTRLAELETELAGRDQERDRLRQEGEVRHEQVEAQKMELTAALASTQQELREEKGVNAELRNRLVRINELEEELVTRAQEVEVLRDDSGKRQAEGVMEKRQLESELESLRGELQREQASNAELIGLSGRMGELEEELVRRDRDLESLRQANEAAVAESLAAKSRLESNLAEVVLARQVEVTHLGRALQEAKDKASAEQEAALALTRQVEALQDSLRQVSEQQAQEQEGVVADLRQEVITLKAMVADLEKKTLSAAGGVVMVKGSHYLPGDVLRRWIGNDL